MSIRKTTREFMSGFRPYMEAQFTELGGERSVHVTRKPSVARPVLTIKHPEYGSMAQWEAHAVDLAVAIAQFFETGHMPENTE